jgi:magnesium transporter
MVNPLVIPELRDLLAQNDLESIRTGFEDVAEAMIAELLAGLEPDEIVKALSALEIARRADVFSHLDMNQQVELVEGQGRQSMARLLEEMSHDDRADLVQALPEHVQDELMPLVAHAERADIRRLASYPEDSVGSVMTTDYAALPETLTVAETLDQVRRIAPQRETVYYVYLIDGDRTLKGVVSLKTLILAKPAQKIADVMTTEVISVKADDDRETVARDIEKYDWLAIPVVDDLGRLVGIVTIDDVLDVLEEEADEDIYALGAAGKHLADYFQVTPFRMAMQRLPWLLVLVFVGFVSATMLSSFESFLENVGLFIFIPMVLGSGGNAGSQTVAVVVRGLATGEIETSDVHRILGKEVLIAAMVGVALAVVAAGLVTLLTGDPHKAAIVGLSILAALLIAKSMGSLLPVFFQKIGLDPALMSAPLITTILDVVAVGVYLLLAKTIMSMG